MRHSALKCIGKHKVEFSFNSFTTLEALFKLWQRALFFQGVTGNKKTCLFHTLYVCRVSKKLVYFTHCMSVLSHICRVLVAWISNKKFLLSSEAWGDFHELLPLCTLTGVDFEFVKSHVLAQY